MLPRNAGTDGTRQARPLPLLPAGSSSQNRIGGAINPIITSLKSPIPAISPSAALPVNAPARDARNADKRMTAVSPGSWIMRKGLIQTRAVNPAERIPPSRPTAIF